MPPQARVSHNTRDAKRPPAKTSVAANNGAAVANGSERYFSRAVGKALEVLKILQLEEAPLGLADVSRRLQLSKTSSFRLMRTLEISGAVTCNAMGQFQLVDRSGVRDHRVASLLRVAGPILQNFSRELGETLSLAALFENRIEVIAVFESPQLIRMSNVVGHIVPPYASSLGKAITAYQSEERREKLLRSLGVYRYTDLTITDRTAIAREFDSVREKRFAVDREETVVDGVCFGVPIFTASGEVAAAISTSLPKSRFRGSEHEAVLVEALTKTAAAIAAGLES